MVKTIVMKRSFTEASQKLHRTFTEASQKLHRSFTEASQKLYRSFTEALQKLFLKATIHRTVFLCKLESFAGAVNILGYQYLRQYLRISIS
jgi:hypothetical protein